MSKLYNEYLKLKSKNKEKIYLFKSGNFYIFIDDDAKKISEITTLKLTNLSSEILKCGFTKDALEKYISIFKNLNINIEIIEEIKENNTNEEIIKKIRKINIDSTTPLKALNILNELKEMLNE